MLPSFLKPFEEELKKHQLETVKISASPIKKNETLSLKQSKFLGSPFLPTVHEYPTSKFGKPLVLFAQINFEEIPPLKDYPRKGIFQIFTSNMFWDLMDDEYYVFLYHENTDQECHNDFSFLADDLYEGLPINCEHKLTFSKNVEYGGSEDSRFDLSFNGKSVYEFREDLNTDEQKMLDELFYTAGHKIGGYAYFTQADPRAYDPEKKNDLLLLQIDSDKEIMFGDAGVSNVFISAENL